jgi:DNA-binding response OmpR family regulator
MPDHILIIEDDEATRYAYKRALAAAGYRTKSYSNYFPAAQDIDQGAGKLLIVDLDLPTGTPQGLSVARMARLHREDLPVIFLVGHPEMIQMLPDDLGAVVLLKPVSPDELLAVVAQRLPPDAD